MLLRPLVPLALAAVGLVASLLVAGLLPLPAARALPPAGEDILNVSAEVSVASRLGEEMVSLAGTANFQRDDPRMEDGVEVVDVEIVSMSLEGESVTGPVVVSQRENFPSTGEIRSLQPPPDQFPASSFFDVFVAVEVPVVGSRSSPTVHNEEPLHLVPMSDGSETSLDAWPPVGVTYQAELDAVAGSQVDVQTFPPGEPGCTSGLPLLPVLPAKFCLTSLTIQFGEPKTPTPTPTPCPVEVCPPTPTLTPSQTATSTPTSPPLTPPPTDTPTPPTTPTPTPQPVTGNDNFADAWEIPALPFTGEQSTAAATTEAGEPTTLSGCPVATVPVGATVWYRFTAAASGTVHADTSDSSFDTVLAAQTGEAIDALTLVACNDDGGPGLLSEISFPVTEGTTYYLQVGGYGYSSGPSTGNLRLNVSGDVTIPTVTPTSPTATTTPLGVVGDASCNGIVNAIDATLVLQLSADLLGSLPCQENGDANLDGTINSIDATLILQYVADLLDSLPP